MISITEINNCCQQIWSDAPLIVNKDVLGLFWKTSSSICMIRKAKIKIAAVNTPAMVKFKSLLSIENDLRSDDIKINLYFQIRVSFTLDTIKRIRNPIQNKGKICCGMEIP